MENRIRLYTIYDRVAEDSCQPFAAVNDGVAARSLKKLLEDVPPVDREEYRLYFIGYWNPKTMVIDQSGDPEEVFGIKAEKEGKMVAEAEVRK